MKKFAVIMLSIFAAAYAAWVIAYPSAVWRYRLTIEVETPEGLKTGSSVIEVQVKDGPSFNPDGARTVFVRGEAVAVDLGARGVLFALLRSERTTDHAQYVVYETFPWPGGPGGEITKNGRLFYQALDAKADLRIGQLPMMVRFKVIADPKTVEKVDPNSLEVSFGQGVKFSKATIQMTKDPVTFRIDSYLPWLASSKGAVTGKTFADPNNAGPENYITSFDMRR